MTGRERIEAACALRKPDRVPFVPAVYEHKARLIGVSPSAICRDPDLLYRGLSRELEVYSPDALTVGIDVYNVEAEALGCRVHYFEASNDVPAIVEPLIRRREDLAALGLPDPERAGRMPLCLEVAAAVAREQGHRILVRGALTGPYSMAAELAGAESFLMASVEDPSFARSLLDFAASVTLEFGRAFIRRGVEPILFDSRATPQLASPRVFRELVLPVYRDQLIPQLKRAGACHIPLIIGGNTNAIVDHLIATGATQLLCDSPSDRRLFREKCLTARIPFRASVDARTVHSGPPEAIRGEAAKILEECSGYPGLLLGCGVVAYDTDPSHVLAIRDAIAASEAESQRHLH